MIDPKTDIEFIARAWATMDGKLVNFDNCKRNPEIDDMDGYYSGYMADAESLIKAAMMLKSNVLK